MPETPSVYFPDEFVTFPAQRGRRNRTTVLDATGREQRRPDFPVGGRRVIRGMLTPLGRANWQVLRDFERGRQGRYGSFWIFGSNVETFVDWSLGTGFTGYPIILPFKARTSVPHASVLKKNGSTNLNATFDSGGPGGELRATAGDAIIAGDTISISTTARERLAARFNADDIDWNVLASAEEYIVFPVDVIELL